MAKSRKTEPERARLTLYLLPKALQALERAAKQTKETPEKFASGLLERALMKGAAGVRERAGPKPKKDPPKESSPGGEPGFDRASCSAGRS